MDQGPVSHNANAEQSLSLLLGDSLPFPVLAESQHRAWYQNTLVCCCLKEACSERGCEVQAAVMVQLIMV